MLSKPRLRGALLAQKYGARRTLDAIKEGACFSEIFRVAQGELGTGTVVEAVGESESWYWCYKALRHLVGLSDQERLRLVTALARSGNWYAAALTLRDVRELTTGERLALEAMFRNT
jgi:hypothetical protein